MLKDNRAKLERMAIKKEYRQKGLGSALIDEVIKYAQAKNLTEIYLHAQVSAETFYIQNGFELVSDDVFVEAGIDHKKMNKLI